MKKAEAPSRINSLSAVEMHLKLPGPVKDLALEVTSALFNDKQQGTLGKSQFNGPWPKEVTELADKLRTAIEDHLLYVYFEVDRDGPNKSTNRKQGIIQSSMERPHDDTPQL